MSKISTLLVQRLRISPFMKADYGAHAKLVPIDGRWLKQVLLG